MQNNWRRVISLHEGRAMVVTDLHGDWDLYRRYRDLFLKQCQAGNLQYLIFSGDVIHRESRPGLDHSLEMVLDIMALQQAYPDQIIYLCGNHELPHIYHVTLAKGDFVYTSRFEAKLGEHRTAVMKLFNKLPFFVRTAAGVSITHAGAAAELSVPQNCQTIFNCDHEQVFERVAQLLKDQDLATLRSGISKLAGNPYDVLAKKFLAVSQDTDPRYNDYLIGILAGNDPLFQLLWATLFTRCEHQYGVGDYAIFVEALLQALSENFKPQQFLVAGHINVSGGYQLIAQQHLRIASGKHALPPKSACYLVFNVAQSITSLNQLTNQLQWL
jgi:hypothetical protein